MLSIPARHTANRAREDGEGNVKEFKGKVAVVTGAAGGIGRALAQVAAGEGMSVLIADVDDAELRETAKLIEQRGGKVRATHTDVSDAAQVETLAETAWSEFGAAHTVFNNAGVMLGGLSWERSLDDWQWVLGVNLWGVIHGLRSFVPRLIEQGQPAHVVNTASVAALVAGPFLSPYLASKHAVLAVTESAHHELELMSSPVRMSLLCPGAVKTGISDSERVRPDELPSRGSSNAGDDAFASALRSGIDKGSDPLDVARIVFAALREDKFWILPHPEFKALVEKRTQSLLDETNPVYQQDMV
jgi:NAD(P)-dependent dehydrogenase (short-subunit alcohol dehydrogenase family)